jgi:hypothetical protein
MSENATPDCALFVCRECGREYHPNQGMEYLDPRHTEATEHGYCLAC